MTNASPRPPWWLKPMNKVLMAVTRVGIPIFGDEGPVILTVPGRTSGKPRSTPITPMTVDGHRYVVSGFPGSDWERNARAADSATLRTRRRSEAVRMVELDAAQARPLLRRFPELVPSGVEFMTRSGLVTEGTPDEFEALAGRCAVFRFDPV
ncbi:nitroreductase/quinone reductase family protein [Gordonia polyisoprenivorans]|uniref:nitroreductase/quinone reductase family protein n=1 Tax=Gordonia polyisoprenivorans TaxID=84595 RepID=UPI0023005063|nr:nitroreductase/quinone reductase family protein [Gordonia polyisoprenivorans]WCB35331.1 nitroreductase/quinone reductase family protein [Gordonia polyisoprenivorans]